MFESARIKLTAWYLLIIMFISVFFSLAFYHLATREIERVINRIEFRAQFPNEMMPSGQVRRFLPPEPTLQDLEESKGQIRNLLIVINGIILIASGAAGYFLAGRTLGPIQIMMDEQNQFISSASHELRTPIATMRAEMEGSLLEKNISDREARSLIESNLEELDNLQTLTNSLLQLARVHNVNDTQQFEKSNIMEILELSQKKVQALSKKKEISLNISGVKAIVLADKKGLLTVFVGILENAIKYSTPKTTISIKTKTKSQNVIISIIDQGIGISKKDLPHIFEQFYRADKSRSEEDGYGLGLSIARKIIEVHKGTIHVKSNSGKGTTFVIVLPIVSV